MKAFLVGLILLLPVLSVSCSAPKNDGGKATYERIEYGTNGVPSKETRVIFNQQEDPKTGSSFRIDREGSMVVSLGTTHLKLPPIASSAAAKIVVIVGALFCAAGIFLFTPYCPGGPHVRLGILALMAGGAAITLVLTVDKFGFWYALGLMGLAVFAGWWTWNAYNSGRLQSAFGK